jgi:RNA polymerase sigma factor (sigma-70 family)
LVTLRGSAACEADGPLRARTLEGEARSSSRTPTCAPDASADDETDKALMSAYAAGDASAFDRLYARQKGPLYRYLLRHCGNAGIADELFQDVWVNVIRARASYAPTARFGSWLFTLAHNRIVDHWRASGQASMVTLGDDDETSPAWSALAAPAADEPDARAATSETRARLRSALAALPPLQRDAFLLHQESGMSLAEIAAMTGVGVETVKSRLRYATTRLRAAFPELGERV